MKQTMKCVLSVMLAFVLCVGAVPAVYATDNTTDSTVDIGNMTVQGTNAFGAMLAEEIDEAVHAVGAGEYGSRR